MFERLLSLAKGHARSFVLLALLLGAAGYFASVVHQHYPLDDWLFFRYAGYWLSALAWLTGVVGVGHVAVERLFRLKLPFHEAIVSALAVGLFAFELTMLAVGALDGFRAPAFGLVPLVFLAGGMPGVRALVGRGMTLFVRHRPPVSALGLAAIAFGLLALFAIYFAMLTPENVQFDSRWKHMSLAEDWVASGGLRRKDEGWLFASRPHMTSLLYSWAFLLPGARLFDKMLLCAHLELVVFLVTTLAGIPALVRRLVPGADPRVVWVARFLFPGVLLYDSSISAGTDHIGGIFVVAAALAMFRAWPRLAPGPTLLVVVFLAAGTMVKETIAIMLVPVPALALSARAVYLVVQSRRGRVEASLGTNAWRTPLFALLVFIVATAPLWLKNLIWYGDPLYPALHRFFSPEPWAKDAAYRFTWAYQDAQMWAPERNAQGLLETFRVLFTFSFEPHDWKRFHRDVPVFGSLFTLLLPCLFLCRRAGRTWLIVGWIHAALFAWYSLHHQDRYLQGLMPLFAAATAAMLLLIWTQHGRVVRAGLAALVGLQLVWGGDVYFFQTHAMARSSLKKSIDLLSAGFERKTATRFGVQSSFQAIGRELPPDARVLLHETNINLGTGRTTVLDNPGWQYAIEYGSEPSPAHVHALLSGLGVTHLHARTEKTKGTDSLAGDIRFYDYLRRYAENPRQLTGGVLAELGSAPEGPFDDSVAVLSCGSDYRPGLYQVTDLSTPPFGPRTKELPEPRSPGTLPRDAPALIDAAEFVVVNPRCFEGSVPGLRSGHTLLVKRNGSKAMASYEIWVRGSLERPSAPSAPSDRGEAAGDADEDEAGPQ